MAGIIAMMVLVIALFSALLIAAESDHDCHGEDCPICECIQQCENTIRQIGGGVAALAAAILPAIIFVLFSFHLFGAFLSETLISKKVRLNN